MVNFGGSKTLVADYIGMVDGFADVLHVAGAAVNLISVSALCSALNVRITFYHDVACIAKLIQDKLIEFNFAYRSSDNLYYLHKHFNLNKFIGEQAFISLLPETIVFNRSARQEAILNKRWQILHEKLGHPSIARILAARSNNSLKGVNIPSHPPVNFFCDACAKGRSHRTPHSNDTETTDGITYDPIEKIYSDLGGPLLSSYGGYRWYVIFVDKSTRYKWIYFLKAKTEVLLTFKSFQHEVKRDFNKVIRTLKTDNGGEYTSDEFEIHLEQCNIRHEKSAPYAQWQNGVAERANRTIKDMARTMLIAANIPIQLWPAALRMAVYLSNRLPTTANDSNSSPYSLLFGKPTDIKDLHVFGCDVYVHIDDSLRTSLEPNGKKCYYLGPVTDNFDGFRYFNPETKRVAISRDGVFNDSLAMAHLRPTVDFSKLDWLIPSATPLINNTSETANNLQVPTTQIPPVPETIGRPQRVTRPAIWMQDYAHTAILDSDKVNNSVDVDVASLITVDGKRTYTLAEVQLLDDWPEYEKAMQVELKAITDNQTWDVIDSIPDDRKPVGYTWTFTCKTHETPIRYKARLCAQGFSQVHGLDYFETFSPVIRQTSIRVILSIATAMNYLLHQMDVNSAFLHGEIDTDIYMRAPPELGIGSNKFVKLRKAIYGLKQSSAIWNSKIDSFFKNIGFKQSIIEPCIYISDANKLIVGIYVDDLIIAGATSEGVSWLKAALCAEYPMKDLGEVKTIIGMQVERTHNKLKLSQVRYIDSVIKRFGMDKAQKAYVPLLANQPLTQDMNSTVSNVDDNHDVNQVPYRQAVGALLYAAQCTRPDISFACSRISAFMNSYTIMHWHAVEQTLRYLNTSKNAYLQYECMNDATRNILVGYCDADWASDSDSRKSQTGYVFYLNGAPVSWTSIKQTTVALSSVESEYMALSSATQELIYLRQLLSDLGFPQKDPTVIYEDNSGCINLSNDRGFSRRTKHIDVRHHFIRDEVAAGRMKLMHIPTARQVADLLTKALPVSKFDELKSKLLIYDTRI